MICDLCIKCIYFGHGELASLYIMLSNVMLCPLIPHYIASSNTTTETANNEVKPIFRAIHELNLYFPGDMKFSYREEKERYLLP